jgi:putative transposase
MRISRKLTLKDTGLLHKMWKAHNREHVFSDNREKIDYLRQLCKAVEEKTKEFIHWYSYCIMTTHAHESAGINRSGPDDDIIPGIEELGNWMRRAHGWFGARYNKRHNREGKVARDRPKTCEIENKYHVLRVMFYGDANPVRAGMVSHPSRYPFSSYQFYANGKKNEFTKFLTPPPAYLELGATPQARQRKYRQLCDQYLRASDLLDDRPCEEMEARFIGNSVWSEMRRAELLKAQKAQSRASPP